MSSSGPEELIVEDHTPHREKEISQYVFSLNMQYIVTWSKDDESIVGWSITNDLSNDLSIEPINSLNTDDLKSLLNNNVFEIFHLKRASDCKRFIILYPMYNEEFAVIDITTKSRQILNVQGLKENQLSYHDDIAFLENGDLAIAKGEPVNRAYIFSKLKFNDKYQWICKNSIELGKYYDYKCKINKNGTLFMYFNTPHVIIQWNLITRKFEMQYILNWNLLADFAYSQLEMNSDNTLLVITSCSESFNTSVYVYSPKSGIEIANKTFNNKIGELDQFCFIGSREKERFFISFKNRKTKNYVTYISNPLTYTLDVSPDTNVLHDILSQNCKVINDYIIKIDKNKLSIKKLSQNENWQNHLQSKERYAGSTFFNTKEIKQFILSILERYKSNQFLTQSYSDVSNEHPGEAYTWIVTNKSDEDFNATYLKAKIKSNLKETPENCFYSYDSVDEYRLEFKVLKNDDIIFVSSSGIQIFSVNSEESSIELIYFWEEDIEYIIRKTQAQESIINHLISFKNKLDLDIGILPTPNFGEYDCYSTLKNNELALKLYGKEIIQKSIQRNASNETNEILDNCYKYSISMFESGDINNFLLFINQITFALVELEKFNKNLKATEKFLLKINLLYRRFYDGFKFRDINDSSLLSHLQYYGIYVHSYLSNTSFFDYLFFWISENWNLLERNYPQIHKILKSPYLFYLSYFAIFPQKNLLLSLNGIPMENNIIFLIWILYSIFMCCFLIVSTISKNEISWNNQVILLILTIFLGFIHFIFEIRQFIHKPMHYITSPWNWFDLAAILFPTITSIIWLHDITIPVWIITISVFLLEIKFLLFFHVLEYFGTYFAIMIGVAQKFFSFLVVLVEGLSLVEIPDDNTNMFALFSTSLLAVYFMLTGDSSAVSSWVYKNNWILVFLMVIFSFFTTIYLLNLFISLLGNAVNETNNEESFLQLKCEILSEIELFLMLPYQRRKKNWFPDILYYEVSVHELKKYIKKITGDEEIFQNIFPSVKKKLQNIFPEIKDSNEEIKDTIKAQKDESLKDLKAQIDELLKDLKVQTDESLKNLKAQINESLNDRLRTQIDEALKEPIDKFNKLIEFIEKKESE
ncbi:wd-40 repeat protein [Gigaspora margarita]|uniref:Wd-40 repeat protein n=1 Tax=Gigaspora margarita TaxID=4874 RepID=A0A8H4A9L4_GIGMA|nr:wd-40 repeat protein [Gigaspora margarita]